MVAGIVATRARSSSRDTSAAESALRKLQWGFPVAVNGAERNCRAFRFAKVDAACGSSDRTEQTAAANVLRMATASVGIDTSRVKRRVDALVDLWYARDDGAALSRAVQTMRSILASDSTSATAWTDLSAALLMQYAITGNNESLLQGFNAACEAHQLDPKSTDALWNRAVAETWLGLRDESERAWLEYKHVSLNEAPIVDYAKDPLRLTPHAVAISGAWREASRKYLWRVVLPAWGSATLSGNLNGVAQALREIDSLVATSTDTDPADSPRAIRDMLLGVDNTRERQEIARGVIALRDYRDAFEQSNLIVASAALKRAQSEPAFEHRFSLWTRYETANVLLVSLKPDSSRKLLTAIAADAVHARPAVSRLARLSLALGRVSGDRQSNAVDEFLALIPLCEQMSDEDCVIAAQGMLGASYILLGDSKRAIDALIVATINSAGAPETTRRWTALNQLRLVASTQNMTGAVAEIDAEMEPLARRLKRVSLQLNSAKQRAELVLGRGSVRDAEAAVDQFVQLYRDRANDSQRMEFRGDWLALRGKLALREHRPDGIVLLDSAVADATKSGNRVRRQPMVYALARAKAEHGDTIAALGDLSVLLAELRERVGSKSSVFELTRLAELNRGASTLAATLQLRRHDARGALNALSDRDFNTPYVHDERPEVVSLAVRELGDSTVVWYVSHDSLRVRVLDTRVREVRRMVLQFDSTSLTGLYAALLEPWLAKHGTSGAPGIRLDVRGAMTAVPWAALRSAKTGKYVAESYELRGVSGRVRRRASARREWSRRRVCLDC